MATTQDLCVSASLETHTTAVVLISTPKSYMREFFCAIRIVPELASVTCLLLDAQLDDLGHIVDLLRSSPPGPARRSPVAFLAMLVREYGRTPELSRQAMDDEILRAQHQTQMTL